MHTYCCQRFSGARDNFVHNILTSMNNDTVKKNLENIRLNKKLSQEEMANVLGVARNTYRNIEKGRTKLISDTVMKVAEWAEITPEEVVLGYVPLDEKDSVLKETRERLNDRIRALTEEYEARLERQRTEIEFLRELNKEKDNNIRTLKSWVAILEKKAER